MFSSAAGAAAATVPTAATVSFAAAASLAGAVPLLDAASLLDTASLIPLPVRLIENSWIGEGPAGHKHDVQVAQHQRAQSDPGELHVPRVQPGELRPQP